MAIWGLIAIQVGLYLLGRLLAPRQPRFKPRPFEKPTVADGDPIAVVLGIGEMEATPELITDISVQSGDNGQHLYYLGKMQLRFGMGPIDVLYDLISDDRSIALSPQDDDQSSSGSDPTITPTLPIWRRGNPTVYPDPVTFQIHVRQIYGGIEDGEGGMEGEFRFYWGTQDQAIDPLIAQTNGDLASRFPWLCHAVLGTTSTPFYLVGNTPTPKPIKAIVGCYPRRLLPDLSGRINQSANLAEMIYEVLRNRVWGKGEPESKFDVNQWQFTARQCYANQLGFSITLKDRRKVDDLLDDLLSHGRAVIVTDPVTGLMQLKLALLDYTESTVSVFSSTNSSKPKRGKVSFARTANEIQVRYSRFFGGATDVPLTEVVTEEVPVLPYVYFVPVPGIRTGEIVLPGDLPPTVLLDWDAFVNDESTPLVGIDVSGLTERPPLGSADYYVNPRLGIFEFHDSARVSLDDKITVEYLLAPGKYAAFIDETVTRQNLSLKRTLGRTISETYDYPYCADKRNAAKIADFLIKASSRQLETFSWTADRSAARKTRGDVVQLKDAKWGGRFTEGIFVRLTKLGVGTRTKPGVTCEGIEDIYGLELTDGGGLLFDPPSSGGVLHQAPPITLSCSGGGFRIGLFPVDPAFLIEIQVSSASDFSSPTTITPDGGMVYDPDLPYFDYLDTGDVPFADGTERYFRARSLPRAGYSVGPWSTALFCIAGGDPVVPTCVDLLFHDESVQGTVEGSLTTVIDADPQIRFVNLEFSTQPGDGPASAFAAGTPGVAVTVPLVGDLISYITRRLSRIRCDVGLEVLEQTYPFSTEVFPPPPPPPPTGSLSAVPIEIPLVTEARIWRNVGAAIEPLGFGRQDWFPFGGFVAGRLTATVRESTLPAGARLIVEYQQDDGSWTYAGDGGGPILAIDSAAALLYENGVMKGLAVSLTEGMKSDRIARLSSEGGDGTGYVIVERVAFQPTAGAEVEPPIEDPPLPPIPSSCDPDDRIIDNTWITLIFDCLVDNDPPTAVHDARGVVDPPDYYGTLGLFFNVSDIVPADVNGRGVVEFSTAAGDGTWRLDDQGILGRTQGWGTTNPAAAELWAVVKVVDGGGLLLILLGPAEGTKIYPTSIVSDFGSNVEHTIPLTGIDLSDGYHLLRIQATSRFKVWVDGVEVYDAANTMFWITSDFPFSSDNGWMGTYGGNPPKANMRIARLDLMQEALDAETAAGLTAHLGDRYDLDVDVTVGPPPPDPGPQPPPPVPPTNPPPPITGGSIFGMEGIPNTGYPGGPWNSTIMRDITPANAVAKFAAITGMQNFWMPQGPQGNYAPGEQFNINLYIQSVRRWLFPSAARTAALDAIADGRVRYLFASDEPSNAGRWGPGGISLSDMRRAVAVLREVFPDCPVVIRCTPDTYGAVIPGLTDYWFTLKVNRGPIASVIPAMLAQAAALGTGLGCSMNCRDFNDVGGGVDASNNPSGWITPSQRRLYGLQLASYSALTFMHSWWMEDPEWYQVAGMAAAELDVRAAWIATHP